MPAARAAATSSPDSSSEMSAAAAQFRPAARPPRAAAAFGDPGRPGQRPAHRRPPRPRRPAGRRTGRRSRPASRTRPVSSSCQTITAPSSSPPIVSARPAPSVGLPRPITPPRAVGRGTAAAPPADGSDAPARAGRRDCAGPGASGRAARRSGCGQRRASARRRPRSRVRCARMITGRYPSPAQTSRSARAGAAGGRHLRGQHDRCLRRRQPARPGRSAPRGRSVRGADLLRRPARGARPARHAPVGRPPTRLFAAPARAASRWIRRRQRPAADGQPNRSAGSRLGTGPRPSRPPRTGRGRVRHAGSAGRTGDPRRRA